MVISAFPDCAAKVLLFPVTAKHFAKNFQSAARRNGSCALNSCYYSG